MPGEVVATGPRNGPLIIESRLRTSEAPDRLPARPGGRHGSHPTHPAPHGFLLRLAAAFKRALELARASRAQLIVAHVIEPTVPMVGEGYIPPQTYEAIEASAHAYGKRGLDKLVKQARKAGVRATARLLEGTPHERIVRAARGCART